MFLTNLLNRYLLWRCERVDQKDLGTMAGEQERKCYKSFTKRIVTSLQWPQQMFILAEFTICLQFSTVANKLNKYHLLCKQSQHNYSIQYSSQNEINYLNIRTTEQIVLWLFNKIVVESFAWQVLMVKRWTELQLILTFVRSIEIQNHLNNGTTVQISLGFSSNKPFIWEKILTYIITEWHTTLAATTSWQRFPLPLTFTPKHCLTPLFYQNTINDYFTPQV